METSTVLVFKDYPIHAITSNSQRAKYFKIEYLKKLPKKYITNIEKYEYKEYKKFGLILFSKETGLPVIENSASVGEPKKLKIGGHKLYSLTLTTYEKVAIFSTLEKYFTNELLKTNHSKVLFLKGKEKHAQENGKQLVYKITTLFATGGGNIGDLDNYELFFRKVFIDTICKEGIERTTKDGKIEFKKKENVCGFLKDDNVKIVNNLESKHMFAKDVSKSILDAFSLKDAERFALCTITSAYKEEGSPVLEFEYINEVADASNLMAEIMKLAKYPFLNANDENKLEELQTQLLSKITDGK